MKKENAIRYYRKFSAADGYIIGFEYKKENYIITVDELMPRWIRVEKASTKNGGHEKLQLRLNNKHKEQLIKKGARKFETNKVRYYPTIISSHIRPISIKNSYYLYICTIFSIIVKT